MGHCAGGKREPQRFCQIAGNAGEDEHGGFEGEDPLQTLRAVQEEQAD